MIFDDELKFEKALTELLFTKGWESEVLKNKTEKDLLDNWAKILFENNRHTDRLGDHPLTDGEMAQIIEQINNLRTPVKLNSFVNGKTVSIKRDNINDKSHFGKEISLKIYDRAEIAAGQSRYQIVSQPIFFTNKMLNDRRGDLLLLINGMPLIHIELKKSGIPISQATNQIKKYAHEGAFQGLFSLIQIFVAMNPEEAVYFANPGPEGVFNSNFFFHWADFNNEPINDWQSVASRLLSIPMAHQLIGFYTVPDDSDGILKVMRSYQYYAASEISNKVAKHNWNSKNQRGGYVWHTTGSGKTLTSFKSAQLIANSKDADKVVFLMDRIELGTQSLSEYKGFANEGESVQATEDTDVLMAKLKSNNTANTLIVTSIQKMNNIKAGDIYKSHDIDLINRKRIVFIIDEAHRSTFGIMISTIKETFPKALFFGFTGTPIMDENNKKNNITADVFGNELHRYSIAHGIRDKNVLGFDVYNVSTYKESDLRKVIGLERAKAKSEIEAFEDSRKQKVYQEVINPRVTPMAGYYNESKKYVLGIEDYLKESQYNNETHRLKVVESILEGWTTLSCNSKFHAIFATSSINEAIEYYRLFKSINNSLKITALFDPNIDNNGNGEYKEDGLVEILTDYNNMYGQDFTIPTHAMFKKDVSLRFAHKAPYLTIAREKEKQLDLLIVVDQMLTGYDSKWINTLYLDKVLESERIIQAFSRTNRLFGPDKPFGTIKCYRKPYTMERNIGSAVKLYSGDKTYGLFVNKLNENLEGMNKVFEEIRHVFETAGISNFEKLPEGLEEKAKFSVLFSDFNKYLDSAKIQDFRWSKREYFVNGKNKSKGIINVEIDEPTYMALVLRYKELANGPGTGVGPSDVPYDIDGYITEINTATIDNDYMNSRFVKYHKALLHNNSSESISKALDDLHRTFATLTQEEQKYANIFLRDVHSGNVKVDESKTLKDYIIEYQSKAKSDQISMFAENIGVDENALRNFMRITVDEKNINEYGRFEKLKNSVDRGVAKKYFEKIEGEEIPIYKLNMKIHSILREFVLSGGFDL